MGGLKRGDIVLAVAPGAYGKPRLAVVVQTDFANETHRSIVACPMTSHIQQAPLFRLDVQPSEETGLNKKSQIMVDKIVSLPRGKITNVVGQLDEEAIVGLNRSLVFWLGLG